MKDSKISLMKGARHVIEELRKRQMKLAIISGSLNVILDYVLPDYEQLFDDVFLSRIFFDAKGHISSVHATPFDMDGKAKALQQIAQREHISLPDCVFIGDHQNDIAIAKEAGLAIAFDCKDDGLRNVCDVAIDKKDLREVLRYL